MATLKLILRTISTLSPLSEWAQCWGPETSMMLRPTQLRSGSRSVMVCRMFSLLGKRERRRTRIWYTMDSSLRIRFSLLIHTCHGWESKFNQLSEERREVAEALSENRRNIPEGLKWSSANHLISPVHLCFKKLPNLFSALTHHKYLTCNQYKRPRTSNRCFSFQTTNLFGQMHRPNSDQSGTSFYPMPRPLTTPTFSLLMPRTASPLSPRNPKLS